MKRRIDRIKDGMRQKVINERIIQNRPKIRRQNKKRKMRRKVNKP